MKIPEFPNVKLVGQFFREKEGIPAFLWSEEVEIGAILSYEREPDNPFDPSAIKIIQNGHHMAYVERGQAAFISSYLDAGHAFECVVTGKEEFRGRPTPIVSFLPLPEVPREDEVTVA